MENEFWKIAGWAGGAVAVIIAITKLLEKAGYKKNGSPNNLGLILQQLTDSTKQLVDNGIKTNNLLERLGDTNLRIETVTMKNSERLELLASSLALGLVNQQAYIKALDELKLKFERGRK